MSGLLGSFDGAMDGLTAADLEAVGVADPTPIAGPADAVAAAAPRAAPANATEAAPSSSPPTPPRRAVDPRAQAVADRLLGRHAATAERAPARLQAAVGAASVDCTPAAPVVIGRAEGDLLVPLGVVSRQHCAVARTAAGYTVVDLGSANGTVVCRSGGTTVHVGSEPVDLHPGDVIATARGRRPIARLDVPGSAV